jgi:type I protein arginine methyltransferase
VYALNDYLAMLSDEARLSAYSGALGAVVKPGHRVIEIGSGFGYFSIVAVRAGAAHVDAVDINPVVHLGRRVAEANGCGDCIRFHQCDISAFAPDERADVIVGDLRGPTPFSGRSLEVMIDARRRLLRAGGTLIGRRDVLYCSPARQPAAFQRKVSAPLEGAARIALGPVAAVAMTTPFQCAIDSGDLLAPGVSWGAIDYETIETPHHRGTAAWMLQRGADVNGVAVWFEAQLGAGHAFSTAPGRGTTTYSNLYLPFAVPVPVPAGGALLLDLAVRLVSGDYVWSWMARVSGADGRVCAVVAQNSIAERVVDPAAFGMPL